MEGAPWQHRQGRPPNPKQTRPARRHRRQPAPTPPPPQNPAAARAL